MYDGVSNHQPHDCSLNRVYRHRWKKISKLGVTGLCAGKSPGTGDIPAQMASDAENVSILWRHHDTGHLCDQWDCHLTSLCKGILMLIFNMFFTIRQIQSINWPTNICLYGMRFHTVRRGSCVSLLRDRIMSMLKVLLASCSSKRIDSI